MALAHYLRGEHAEALDWAHRAMARKTNWWVSYATRIASLWALKRQDDACEAAKTLRNEVPLLRAYRLPLRPIAEKPAFLQSSAKRSSKREFPNDTTRDARSHSYR
jgi:hypothetical protein